MSKHLDNPDWYRVKYTIAAECANWAFAEEERRSERLDEAAKEVRELLEATERRLGRDLWGRRSMRRETRSLKSFLRKQIQPSALVLRAGIELARSDSGAEPAEKIDPRAIVRQVEEKDVETADLSYNLACFWAQAGEPDRAWRHLRDAVARTPVAGREALRRQVERDPVLQTVQAQFDFEVLFSDAETTERKSRHFQI